MANRNLQSAMQGAVVTGFKDGLVGLKTVR